MYSKLSTLAAGVVAAVFSVSMASGADAPTADAPIGCRNGVVGGVSCIATKKDLNDAKEAFKRGIKLHKNQRFEEALAQFDEATWLVPQNREYLTAREVLRSKLAFDHIQRGNALLLEDARTRAAAEFRAALDLDPGNQFAEERLREVSQQFSPALPRKVAGRWEDSEEIHLEPSSDLATFHFHGDVKSLFTELAAAYKITLQFDDAVQKRQVRFNVDNVDFFTALNLACKVSKTMWAALEPHQMLILADSAENHKQYDHMSLRRFILPPHSTPQEATDMVNTMRQILDLRYLSSGQTADIVEVRGPQRAVEACARLMEQFGNPKPQVMIDVRVYQISHMLTRNIGVHIPNTFNLYNIPAYALAGLGGQNIQDLINQLIASGGINQAGSTSLAGLLSQLTGQQNSIFSQPLATFGGGLTFMGLSLDKFAAQLSLNESWVHSLDDVSLRAGQGTDATLHLGQRYPILNASYAPIFNSPQIARVLGNQSYIPPIPSVSYEDLGLNLKAKPNVHGDGTVSLQLELQVRSLTGQSENGVPVISNREYKASINLKDGEPAFVAGEISNNDVRSMSGIPGLGFVPGLNMAMVSNTRQEDYDELMIAITPHVISNFDRGTSEIWLSER
jgi:tetratricopeptide (TPR) repeat protein